MNTDLEEQEDELLALQSIFDSEEFVRDESKPAGEIRVSVELPADFSVAMKEGETLIQCDISFLPPQHLTFELPEDYPSSSPPSFTLTCSWLTPPQLAALSFQLTDLYQATGGAVVLFTWVQFLKEDALKFLDIHSLLEIPSDGPGTAQDKQNASSPQPKNHQPTTKSEPTDDQRCDASGPREPDISALSLEVQENPSTSEGRRSADPQEASLSDSHEVDHRSSGPNTDDEKTLSSGTVVQHQIPRVSEAEQTLEYQDDLSSATGRSKNLPSAQSDQTGQEDFSNEGEVPASLLPPSISSGHLDPSEQGAASPPDNPEDSPQKKGRTLSGLPLTPSQTLLSQILIHDAAQKQKVFATTVFDCGVCFTGWLGSACVQLPACGHIFCRACLGAFCKVQITEGNVRGVTCPQAGCPAAPTPAQVRSLVGEELFSRYDRLLLQSTLDCMPDVTYCPRPSCGSAVILEKSSSAALCSVCRFAFCVTCRKTYHGTDDCQTKKSIKLQIKRDEALPGVDLPQSQEGLRALWDDYDGGSKKRRQLLESRYGRGILQKNLEMYLSEDWIVINSKACPYCFSRIQKDQGCNRMICSQCRRLFCWACLTRLGQSNSSSHFQDYACSANAY
ncbi:E3 ubiquitin-protein ligase RNF14-like [Brachyistius frenatus]|uniref:E3 ubiquitin-protein ligase RNF14-like n=1 Tax=Brachyistius frenatus TaxID=100188 RepID=UPI0037E81DDC